MDVKVYNEFPENKDVIIISFFDGVKEDRLRLFGFKTYSISCRGGWSVFNKVDSFYKKIEGIIKKENDCKIFLFAGICKLANLALGLSVYAANIHKDKKILCLGAPFCFDCDKGESPSCNGTSLSPAVIRAWRIESNRKNISIYGDARNIEIDENLKNFKIIQFIPYNNVWDLDLKNKEKMSKIASFTYLKEVKGVQSNEKVHAFLIDFLKNEEERNDFLNKILEITYESS